MEQRIYAVIAIIVVGFAVESALSQPAADWYAQAQETLQRAVNLEKLNKNVAKNIIIFLGDGMGVATVTSARIKKGQDNGQTGEEYELNMDKFPHVGMSKTYNTDRQTPDSAGTATAYLCGAKTKYGVIGLDDGSTRGDCAASIGSEIPSILEIAQQHGMSVGVVTTTRVTHATPSASYAHIPDRYWEYDGAIPTAERDAGCDRDIAIQLVENTGIQVVLGGGRRNFMLDTQTDPEETTRTGYRTDGRDLITEWIESKPPLSAMYVWNEDQFNNVDPAKTDFLLGLFERSHMNYEADRANDIAGGRIDHAHHDNRAGKALIDAVAFDDAVQVAKDMTSSNDTLIVVTADHSHTNAITGNPSRGNPILGKVDTGLGGDDLPYTTILYTDGPGGFEVSDSYLTTGSRPNITDVNTEDPSYIFQSLVPQTSESHGGEDVAIFADGPMAHLIHGIHEQHYITHMMQYAACIGDYEFYANCQANK
uniref:alkaline phosphatase n=1 Tax=Saccoglossus kowalevskii TaxID=10224 RepID=A0ABM0LV71_SACKO|nr:PREDICTED: alkaline phosphatase, tissue-nonspecific isozyme-like [Saccoglossus kowalevskii]